MSEKHVYFDSGAVKREFIEHAHEEGKFIHHVQQDLEPVIDLATQMREEHHKVGARTGDEHHMVPIAEIPLMVYEQAVREGWYDDSAAWRRWLNDPQNAVFRVTPGRV